MVINIFVRSVQDDALTKGINILAVIEENTVNETIVFNKIYTSKEQQLMSDIERLIKASGSAVSLKYILEETDILTATSTKYSEKKIKKLIGAGVSKFGHGLTYDYKYHLADTDYYIFSLLDDRMLKWVKQLQQQIGNLPYQVYTENQMILSVLLKRGRSGNVSDDCIIVNNKSDHYVCYLTTETGIPYRILNVNSVNEVKEIAKAADIHKCIPINCTAKTFDFEVSISITSGTIKDNYQALCRQPWSEAVYKFEESGIDVILPRNSINYKDTSKKKIKSAGMYIVGMIILLVSMLGMGFLWFRDIDNQDWLTDIVTKYTAKVVNMPYVESDDYAYKLDHDRLYYLAEKAGIQPIGSGVVYIGTEPMIEIVLGARVSVSDSIDFQTAASAEGYKANQSIDQKTGNNIYRFTLNSLKEQN